MVLLGQVWSKAGRHDEAIGLLSRAVTLAPRNVDYHVKYGEVLVAAGRNAEALVRYDRTLKLKPGYPAALAGKAGVYLRMREPEKARLLLGPFVEAGTEGIGMALSYARAARRLGEYDAAIRVATRHLADDAIWPLRQGLWFEIGAAHEAQRCFDEAFDAYRHGNEMNPAEWDPVSISSWFDGIMATFDRDTVAGMPRATDASSLPVLIVGLPRCGSTLVEQIIDAHPQAHGAGELTLMEDLVTGLSERIGSTTPYPQCVRDMDQADVDALGRWYVEGLVRIAPRADRVCDKQLSNFAHLGVVAAILPGVRVIHVRRDPIDTCLSCYVNRFAPGTPGYLSDLRLLGLYYNDYLALMEHWRGVLQIPMLELDYERLVADPDVECRRLVEFCGLPWDDRCLRFFESGREVLTLSRDQVNRPIYSTSVGRSRKYLKHLGPLRDALAGGRATAEGVQ
jgi:tetratricopeptide (TPR) repeat protein